MPKLYALYTRNDTKRVLILQDLLFYFNRSLIDEPLISRLLVGLLLIMQRLHMSWQLALLDRQMIRSHFNPGEAASLCSVFFIQAFKLLLSCAEKQSCRYSGWRILIAIACNVTFLYRVHCDVSFLHVPKMHRQWYMYNDES